VRPLGILACAALVGLLSVGMPTAQAVDVEGTIGFLGSPAGPAVVYLEAPPGATGAAAEARVVMDQKNLTFLPHVLPVVRGTKVEFTNSDDVEHNVFSPSRSAGRFDLGTYGPGATRTVTLTEAGDVRVLCNIHMEMEAHILVLGTPYFATVAPDGRYRIADVPAGTYTLKIWRERWLPLARTIEVPASGTVIADVPSER